MGTQTVDALLIKTDVMALQVWGMLHLYAGCWFPHHLCIYILSSIQNGCADLLQDDLVVLIHIMNCRNYVLFS